MFVEGHTLAVLIVLSLWFLVWGYTWIFHPCKCQCGKRIWTRRAMKKHLATKHVWD